MEKAHCVDTDMLHNAFAISDVVTDFVIISLPVPMVCEHSILFLRGLGFCEKSKGKESLLKTSDAWEK